MARKSPSGKFIISASEVGSFVVCQEAWRLKELERVASVNLPSADKGKLLHKSWAEQLDYYHFLKRAWPHIILLMLLAIATKIIFER